VIKWTRRKIENALIVDIASLLILKYVHTVVRDIDIWAYDLEAIPLI